MNLIDLVNLTDLLEFLLRLHDAFEVFKYIYIIDSGLRTLELFME